MRHMATVRKIEEVKAIEGADRIEAYRVGGWWVVDQKNAYSVGDLAVYCEVDSWIPHQLAPFLTKPEQDCRQYNSVNGERLRTVRLKKQLSQGLLLRVYGDGPSATAHHVIRPDGLLAYVVEGDDVSELLGIQKYEPPVPAQLAGLVRGAFPTLIPKTDQERVQNIDLTKYLGEYYEVTEKLHGSSCTFYLDPAGEFHVCSRNLSLKPDLNNSFWKMAYHYNIEQRMRDWSMFGYAIQGELCGTGINGNNYGLGLDFFVFDIYQTNEGYISPGTRRYMTSNLGLKHVPVLHEFFELNHSKEILLSMAEDKSVLAECKREGLVFKSNESDKTFKAVSNSWLLAYE